mgnify:FL=1
MEPRRSKHFLAHIPTIALLVVFAMSAPLGVLFFILRAIDRDAEKKEQENADYSSDFRSQDTGAGQTARNPEPVYGHDVPTAEQQNAKKWHKTLTNLCTIMGAVFLFAGVTNAVDVISVWKFWPDPGELFSDIAMAIGGGGALLTGLRMKSTRKLERLLDKIVGTRDNIPLDELFAAAGIDADRGRAAVERAIDHGYFGADAYIDNRTGTLVVRGAAPQPPRPAEPAPAPAPEDQYTALQRQLRQANDAIPDPVMTAKISRLEDVSARIFALAKKDPDKKAQLQKFMDYYLPTALKLLNTYAQLSAQDVQGTNITEAKQSIERSMDLLITAFENQLDKLFASDALDVSTDIAALEGMLNLDGLTGGDFAPRS